MQKKYLLMQRSAPRQAQQQAPAAPNPEIYAAFNAWREKFKANIQDMGGRLGAGGKILTTSGVIDGPFAEAKEVVGGFMIVAAASYEEALAVASGCPGLIAPGSSCEIREIFGP